MGPEVELLLLARSKVYVPMSECWVKLADGEAELGRSGLKAQMNVSWDCPDSWKLFQDSPALFEEMYVLAP
jgi:hypothetical protein